MRVAPREYGTLAGEGWGFGVRQRGVSIPGLMSPRPGEVAKQVLSVLI